MEHLTNTVRELAQRLGFQGRRVGEVNHRSTAEVISAMRRDCYNHGRRYDDMRMRPAKGTTNAGNLS